MSSALRTLCSVPCLCLVLAAEIRSTKQAIFQRFSGGSTADITGTAGPGAA